MIAQKQLELLQFDKIISLIRQKCFSQKAKLLCDGIFPKDNINDVLDDLHQINELKNILAANDFFPSIEHTDIGAELNLLGLEGSLLHEEQLRALVKTAEVSVVDRDEMVKFMEEQIEDLQDILDNHNQNTEI
jgi:dsDNA-specific endonuclease/ATPase MutS2